MQVDTVVVGMFEVNCYIVWAHGGKEALVIDPGADAGAICGMLSEHALKPAMYLLTHGHVDHVGGLAEMLETHPAPVAMHAADAAWAFGPDNQILPFYPAPRAPEKIAHLLKGGDVLAAGELKCNVIATPGHTPGGVCFYFEEQMVVFTGDTLFEGSVGRTDLPGGDGAVLRRSITRLAELPESARVMPGHGAPTSIGQERAQNPFMTSAF